MKLIYQLINFILLLWRSKVITALALDLLSELLFTWWPRLIIPALHIDRVPLLRPCGWKEHQLIVLGRNPTAIININN